MPKGNRLYRWVATAPKVWQLEDGRPGSRHFRGCVSGYSRPGLAPWFTWYTGSGEGYAQGEADFRRQAMDEVERRVLSGSPTPAAGSSAESPK